MPFATRTANGYRVFEWNESQCAVNVANGWKDGRMGGLGANDKGQRAQQRGGFGAGANARKLNMANASLRASRKLNTLRQGIRNNYLICPQVAEGRRNSKRKLPWMLNLLRICRSSAKEWARTQNESQLNFSLEFVKLSVKWWKRFLYKREAYIQTYKYI